MDYRADLLCLAEAYCAHTGRSEARVANLAGASSTFFKRARSGARCWPETADKIKHWFSEHWPADCLWPEEIERPSRNLGPPAEVAA